jgi:hypothetical protein
VGGWRRLHNEQHKSNIKLSLCFRLHSEGLHNLYASTDIRVIKSRKMRWAENIARMGEMRNSHNVLVGKS